MTADKLPSVLQHPRGSISMERALKLIREMLCEIDPASEAAYDRATAALDDVETMLELIDRD